MSTKGLKHKELLSLQTNADENQNKENSSNKEEQLVKIEAIDGTPFHLVYEDSRGYFIVMGRHRLTDAYKTPAEACELLLKDQYNIILRMFTALYENMKGIDLNEAEREKFSTIETVKAD